MGKRRRPPQKRRARGTGTIFFDRRRQCWIARVPAGRTAAGGTKYREVRADSQGGAVAKMKLVQPPGPDTTVGEWADRWLAGLRVRATTLTLYRRAVRNRIKPSFGAVRLAALTPWHIESAAAAWSDPRSKNPLSPVTLINTLATISGCLQAAVRAELIPRNPAALVRRPRMPQVKFDLFGPAELRTVIDTAATDRFWYAFALCAALGLRIGEAAAIDSETDYDDAAGLLTISRTRTPAGMHPPKSDRSHRTVRVPEVVRPLLAAGVPGACYATMSARWAALLAKAGLRYRNPHQLRHSVATHALAAGMPLANVARDLGDTEDTIVKTYVHPTPGRDLAETMGGLLGGGKVAGVRGTPAKRGRGAASR